MAVRLPANTLALSSTAAGFTDSCADFSLERADSAFEPRMTRRSLAPFPSTTTLPSLQPIIPHFTAIASLMRHPVEYRNSKSAASRRNSSLSLRRSLASCAGCARNLSISDWESVRGSVCDRFGPRSAANGSDATAPSRIRWR